MDFSTAASALASIQNLTYFIVFLLFVIEGPILNYVAGFSSSLGFFNIFIILILAILGNIVGDVIYYGIGRFGRKKIIERFFHFSLRTSELKKIRNYLKKKPGKALAIIKIAPILPVPGLILAGKEKVPFRKFLFYSSIISTLLSSIFVILGYYSGALFVTFFNYYRYSVLVVGALIVITIIFWFLMGYLYRKMSNRIRYY